MLVFALWTVVAAAGDPCVAVEPPGSLVALVSEDDGLRVDPRYHGPDNFTGAPLPGYDAPVLWARPEVAEALSNVVAALREDGLTLVILDAYRPVRATREMVAWTERTEQTHLVRDGYIAARSGHNHGHTVDLTLADRKTGAPLDLGTPFDHFGPESHHGAAVSEEAAARRVVLKRAMQAAGFVSYSKEWWHYRLPVPGTTPLDVPMACAPPAKKAPVTK